MPKVRITDVSLRDGSHPIFHQFDRQHIVDIAGALDAAGVPVLEVTHGVGTIHDLKEAHKRGAKMARVATHCTEADISAQHIAAAKDLGMEAVGFLMMAHMIEAEPLAAGAKLMESYGADLVYVVDSA